MRRSKLAFVLLLVAAHASAANLAQDHIAANEPSSCRLSDGSSWIATLPVSISQSVPVTGTFWQVTQPVSGTVTANVGSGTQPVSGTFWQATQPVSGSVSVSNLPASQAVTGTFWQTTQPVSLASAPSTPVTGTFWQATQPVSVASMPSTPVTGTFWQATQPVSLASAPTTAVTGTFWQATQPISHANLDVALSTRLKPADTLAGVTALGSITGALPAGTNRVGAFRPVDSTDADLTNVKGTQTARAVGTQDLKDSGRTALRFYFNAVAAGTTGTEIAITMTKSSGTAATSSAASFIITSGKTFRITSILLGSRGHLTATAQISNCRVRVNTAGAVTTSSTPVIYDLATATPATALAWDRATIQGFEGDEIAGNGTIQFGVTCAAVYTTNAPTWFGVITGYEY